MQNKVPAWKKTAVATVALSMLAGSATGLVASAKEHGHNGGHGEKNDYGSYNNNDNRHDDDDDDHAKYYGKANVRYNLEFKDLNEQQWKWAYQFIIRLAAQGVFKGYEDGSFKPNNKITRLETLITAVRVLGLEAEAQKPENMNAKLNFKDFNQLKKKMPQSIGYVKVALENDLFNENDTAIQADQPATRLWVSVLLVKAMKLEAEAKAKMGVDLPFRDSASVPAASVGYVAVAVEKGLIAGYNDHTFQPNKPVTRAELATILAKLGVQLPDQEHDDGAVTGIITVNANGTITVRKSDNTTVNYTLDAAVFVFRNGVKVPVTALQAGDELSIRIVQGRVIFIEVTKVGQTPAPAPVTLTDVGKVNELKVDSQGKATLSLTKETNGVPSTIVYNLSPNVTFTGAFNGVVVKDQIVAVTIQNNLVTNVNILS